MAMTKVAGRRIFPTYALQGSRDISENEQENAVFRIFDVPPKQVLLSIYGERYSQAFYTELGIHSHTADGTLAAAATSLGSHTHGDGSLATNSAGNHHHRIWIDSPGSGDNSVDAGSATGAYQEFFTVPTTQIIETDGAHSHDVTGTTGSTSLGSHTHDVTGSTSSTGLTISARTAGSARTYSNNVRILIDGIDRTVALLAQAGLVKFGDGTAGHVLVTTGVDLDISAYITTTGKHTINLFHLGADGSSNGGMIRWVLYIFA